MPPPNDYAIVVQCANETGDLIKRDSTAFTDYCARKLHAKDPNWGRKVRRNGEWGSRNADAIAYLMDGDVTRKHLVDIVVNSSDPGGPPSPNAATAWQVHEGPNVGNGYWMLEPGTPPPDPPPSDDVEERVDALEAAVIDLEKKVDALALKVAGQAQTVKKLEEADVALALEIGRLRDRVGALEQAPGGEHVVTQVRTAQAGWGPLAHSHVVTVQQPK
jgi:uncharacterized coiled-coil protein SlyX